MDNDVLRIVKKYLNGRVKLSSNANVLCVCPFHKNGMEKNPSLSVSMVKGVFFCFSCHESGNIKDLLIKVGVPHAIVEQELSTVNDSIEKNKQVYWEKRKTRFSSGDVFKAELPLPESVLGAFDLCPTVLIEDGFDSKLLKKYDIGYDRRLNRVTYPIRDLYGNLAGFSGGATKYSDTQIPKYKVYQGGRMGYGDKWIAGDLGEGFDEMYPGYKCENHNYVWNFHNIFKKLSIGATVDRLVVVEGFKACLWMIQCGFENTVALMGSALSDTQRDTLLKYGGPIILFLDNDEAGISATNKIGNQLKRIIGRRALTVRYPPEDFKTQPDDYDKESIRYLVENAKALHGLNRTRVGGVHA